jgi:hypothetical protein
MVTNAPISALVTVGMVKCVTNLMAAAFWMDVLQGS